MEIPKDRHAIDAAFDLLKDALRKNKLPTEGGELRTAHPGEFMLMHGEESYWYFKHSWTRNYVMINRRSGALFVPQTGGPWRRGFFDYPEVLWSR